MSVGDIVANVEQVDEKVGHFSVSIPDFMLDLCTDVFFRHKAGSAALSNAPAYVSAIATGQACTRRNHSYCACCLQLLFATELCLHKHLHMSSNTANERACVLLFRVTFCL